MNAARRARRRNAWIAAAMLVVALLPCLGLNGYHLDVLTNAGIFMLLALGLNLVVGFTGLLHLGYAAFFAIGAYTYGLLNLHWQVPFWAGLAPAVVISGCCGVALGIPAMRVRGDYLAIVTLGFGEIVRLAFTNLDRWTGGPNGLLGIAHPTIWLPGRGWYDFSVESLPYYYLVAAAVALAAAVCWRLADSRIGHAWMAIREDELAASCAGINATHLKLLAQGWGAAIAGLAGAIFAAKQGTITPDSFDFILSVMLLAMVVFGGLGSIVGVMIGALVLGALPEVMRGLDQYRMLLFGLVMILMMRWRPQGLLGGPKIRRELTRA
ncbi:MAG: high-affinity branched-chain amino acid ABC transporter permease LivM [Candidatus Omnitrophica bacterium]|nr:high-affinity branched-chain amino acid ABC transporter permease LivM [Candidatus Omnitrophota bacterium]